MQVNFTFRRMQPNHDLKTYIEGKVDRLRKYDNSIIEVHAVLSTEKFHRHAELSVRTRGSNMKVSEASEDIYASVDLAIDKLERKLRRRKEKIKDHK